MIAAIAPRLVALAVAAMAGAVGAWQYQANKYERLLSEQRTEYATAQVRAVEIAHADTIRLQTQTQTALAAAATRLRSLDADRGRLRVVSDGLRDELAAARVQLPDASCASVRQHAATLSDVFGECAAEIEGLAGPASGHAIDSLKLQESWPANRSSTIE